MMRDMKEEAADRVLADSRTVAVGRFKHANLDHSAMRAVQSMALARAQTRPELFKAPEGRGHPAGGRARKESLSGRQVDPVEIVSREIRLHSLPRVVLELQRAIDDPKSSANDLARIISLDPGLSAYLLRIVNSAMYSFPSRVDTVSRAVAVLGTRQISMLAMGVSVLRSFNERPVQALDIERFWRHSVACAILARSVAERCGRSPSERFFVAGLLHDVGRLAIFEAIPEQAREIMDAAEAEGIQLVQAERRVLGFDHARLGAILLRKWNFPVNLAMAVLHHHAPGKSDLRDEAAVVHLADILSKALGYGTTASFSVPALEHAAWDALGLDERELTRFERELDERFEETMAMLGQSAN